MNLAELEYKSKAYISKINGDKDFKARVSEMGFVKGEEIRLVKSAPFKGPSEYEILGYKVSLRIDEAEMIEIIPNKSDHHFDFNHVVPDIKTSVSLATSSNQIRVALVGNPNSGKTSLFNRISRSKEKTGNYGGVTIEQKTARLKKDNYEIEMTDLPGTYSITEFTPEEKYVRSFLQNEHPDLVINVIDATNLERNLYLTTQLLDMGCRVIIVLNMYDELLSEGLEFNFLKLSQLLNTPIIPTIATKGTGIDELINEVIKSNKKSLVYNKNTQTYYGQEIEKLLTLTEQKLNQINGKQVINRFDLIKIIEKDYRNNKHLTKEHLDHHLSGIYKQIESLEASNNDDIQQLITNARYRYIKHTLSKVSVVKPIRKQELSDKIDNILLHKVFGMPIFLAFMFITFWATFNLGKYPQMWIENGFILLGNALSYILPQGILQALVVDGIVSGIGGVLIFLPNIIILFIFISFMEDSGYMSRASFIMDNFMQKIGLQGKSFIPLIIGFGCNVPAILATRTIRSKRDRYITMLMIPFMSCSARLPVYVLIVGAFFPSRPALTIFGLYIFGILLSVLFARFINITIFKKKLSLFVMELPPYRMPSVKTVGLNMWFKSSQYLKKIGKIILVASVIIWALSYFPIKKSESQNPVQTEIQHHNNDLKDSYLGQFGKFINPVLKPLGFDWKLSVSLLSGLVAKEVILSSMSIIYNTDEDSLNERLTSTGIDQLTALSFLLFILIYLPCISVISTLYKEGGWKIAGFSVVFNSVLAWFISATVFQVGSLLF